MTWKITGAPGTGDDLLYSQAGTPTLDLRFASSKSLNDNVSGQNLIDFTRGGNGVGTYVGSDGLIKNSVVNLLLRSEEFDNAIWVKTRSSVSPNAAIAPDGTLTADKLIEDTSTNNHICFQTPSLPAAYHSFSVYVKSAERTQCALRIDTSTASRYAVFDLTSGTVLSSDSLLTSRISPVQNGWFRVSVSLTTVETAINVVVLPATGGTYVYAGNGTSGIYLWGAQIEANATTPGEYVKTTSSISGAPRFDHDPTTGESLGLLIEESRANLLLNSETLATQNVTVTAVAHTLSFYGTGTVTLSGTHSATVVGTGAYPTRTTLTFTPTAGTLTVTVSGTVQYANLEIGSFATSWIPTLGTTVTRNADAAQITGSNFSRWYSQSQGTVLIETSKVPTFCTLYSIDDTTSAERITPGYGSAVNVAWRVVDAGSDQWNSFINNVIPTPGLPVRHALSYKQDDFAGTANGLTPVVDVSGNIPTVTRIVVGANVGSAAAVNGAISRLAYFDRRLPNAVLQAITA